MWVIKWNKARAEKYFREKYLPFIRAHYEPWGMCSYSIRKNLWRDYLDRLVDHNNITQEQRDNWVLPQFCKPRKKETPK